MVRSELEVRLEASEEAAMVMVQLKEESVPSCASEAEAVVKTDSL